jgi:hypothetical protein
MQAASDTRVRSWATRLHEVCAQRTGTSPALNRRRRGTGDRSASCTAPLRRRVSKVAQSHRYRRTIPLGVAPAAGAREPRDYRARTVSNDVFALC